jgi:F0F1-type ATP synthase, alpha subunit
MTVEQQVMVIYAVTNGLLDNFAVSELKAWEHDFLEYMRTQAPQVGDKIRNEKALSKETEAELKKSIESFNNMRTPKKSAS